MDKGQMITIGQLKKLGFKDLSKDKNGFVYRKPFQGGMIEISKSIYEENLRLQTKGSGITIELKGVKTIEQLYNLWEYITGESL